MATNMKCPKRVSNTLQNLETKNNSYAVKNIEALGEVVHMIVDTVVTIIVLCVGLIGIIGNILKK